MDKITLNRQDIQTILRCLHNEKEFVKSKLKTLDDPNLDSKLDRISKVQFKLREFKRINGI